MFRGWGCRGRVQQCRVYDRLALLDQGSFSRIPSMVRIGPNCLQAGAKMFEGFGLVSMSTPGLLSATGLI